MNWDRAVRTLCLVALTVALIWGVIWRLAPALQAWGNSAPGPTKPTVDAATAMIEFIDRPCASVDAKGHLLPDGPICELNQAIHDIRKITTQSGKQVEQTGTIITAAAHNLDTVGESVKETAGHLNKTVDAATETLHGASATLQTINGQAGPLMQAYTQSGNDLDAILKDHAIHQTLDNVQSMTSSGAGILADSKLITDKFSHDYLTPVPWYKQPGKMITLGFDAALLAK